MAGDRQQRLINCAIPHSLGIPNVINCHHTKRDCQYTSGNAVVAESSDLLLTWYIPSLDVMFFEVFGGF